MKLKLTKDGHAVVRDGKPVYVHGNGREEAFDAPTAMKMLVGEHFKTSPVAGGLKIPSDVAASFFGDSFRIEQGQLVAYDKGDIPMFSRTRHGEVATFEEALSSLIDSYPNKDMIIRKDGGDTAPGMQARNGITVTRAQFDSMPQDTRGRFLNEGGRIDEAGGTGAQAAARHDSSGTNVINRASFDAMPPRDRAMHFKNGGRIVD
jgi:hypothetical protein